MTCVDTWFSVWLEFDTWIWAVFLLIQANMLVYLLVLGRTDKIFRYVFFVFFVAFTVVDCLIGYLGSEGKNPSTEEAAYDEIYGCGDWSAWLRFETWTWAVFMLVQVTMVVFLVVHGRRDKNFRQAFYVFFAAVTVIDCVLVLWRPPSLEYQYDETVFGTYYEYPWVEDPLRKGVMAFKAPIASLNDVSLRFIIPVFIHAQPLFLTAIAVNRLTAICFPLKHAAIWRARTVSIVVFALAMMALFLGAGVSVIAVVRQAVVCSAATAKGKEDLNCEAWWVFYETAVPNALFIFVYTVCCFVCFALNIASITMMLALRATGKLRQKAPELRLFGE